jgi:hypothetical protein
MSLRIGLLLLAVAGLVRPAAATDYCAPEAANVVFYLDVTTPYDELDKQALVSGFGRVFETLKGGERLSIRTIEDSFPRSARVLEACVPWCPDNGILGDLFSKCTEGAAINDNKALRRDIVAALAARLNAASELPHSEIVRTIALSAPEEYRADRTNRIVIFSDMIENSEYLPGRTFFSTADGALIEKIAADRLIPDLFGAEVRVFGVGRTGTEGREPLSQQQLGKLVGFWTTFFAAAGADASLSPNLVGN